MEIFTRQNIVNGYLKFVPKGVSNSDLYNCEYFFFNNFIPFESMKIRNKVQNVQKILNDRIIIMEREELIAKAEAKKMKQERGEFMKQEQLKQMFEKAMQQASKQNETDVSDEMRKFKQLFDEGIILEEEFNFKKKEL